VRDRPIVCEASHGHLFDKNVGSNAVSSTIGWDTVR